MKWTRAFPLLIPAFLVLASCGARVRSIDPSIPSIVEIGLGVMHACALRSDGTVWCWGVENYESLYSRWPPRLVKELAGVRRIAVGDTHACAVLRDGSARCWGDDLYGQRAADDRPRSLYPRYFDQGKLNDVPGLSGIVEIATGTAHTCFLLKTGSVVCRGGWKRRRHVYNQSDVRPCVPAVDDCTIVIDDVSGVVHLAGSRDHFCALLSDGTARCWRYVAREQPVFVFEPRPVSSPGIHDAISLAVGRDHACAVLRDGAVECWGSNAHGQLGVGDKAPHDGPVRVRDMPLAASIAVGDCESCAVARNGTARCWGTPNCVPLEGSGARPGSPKRIRGIDDVVQVAIAPHDAGLGIYLLTREGAVVTLSWNRDSLMTRFRAADLGAHGAPRR